MYLGVPDHKKGYRLMDVTNGNVVFSRDVIFNESEFPALEHLMPKTVDSVVVTQHKPSEKLMTIPLTSPETPTGTSLPTLEPDSNQSMMMNMVRNAIKRSYALVSEKPSKSTKKSRVDDETQGNVEVDTATETKSQILAPSADETARDAADERERLTLVHALIAIRYVSEPKTYKEAMTSPQAKEWRAAARSEVQSQIENNTFYLVLPSPGRKVLKSRWVWVVKYNGKGEIDRCKARLVVQGFLQKHGIDYNEIFAPVNCMEVLRLLLTNNCSNVGL
jgi:hypothetical protein